MPVTGWNDELRAFCCRQIRAKYKILRWSFIRLGNRQYKGTASVEMPDLGGINLVPVIVFTPFKQKVDTGSFRASLTLGNPCFAVMSTFGVRGQAEPGNDVVCSQGHAVL